MKKLVFLFILISISYNIFSDEFYTWDVNNNFKNNIYQEKNVELIYSNNKPVYYTIKKTKYTPDENTDLYLSFDKKQNYDYDYNYKYIYNKYHKSENKAVYDESAYFIGEDERIELIGKTGSFFQSGVNLESFSIKFWLYPTSFSSNEIILRIGSQFYSKETDSVEDQSINVKMTNGRLIWDFNNLFITETNKKMSFKIESYSHIIPEKWSHINLTYDFFTGIIRLYINGIEEGIVVATEDGSLDSSILNLRYHTNNRCIIMIAPSFYGAIDEFCITKNVDNMYYGKYVNNGGELLSDVIDFGKGGLYINDILPNGITYNNTDLIYYYRYSSIPFNKNEKYSQNIRWKSFNSNEFLNIPIRFFQWKVIFLAGDNGNYSPKFKSIKINYEENIPPSKPRGIKVISCDNKIKLKWLMNTERDLKGYKIYYGTKSGQYFGDDANEGPSPIDIGLNNIFELTGLNENIIYYIVITAYDDDNEHIHESDFSTEVSDRPFGICDF